MFDVVTRAARPQPGDEAALLVDQLAATLYVDLELVCRHSRLSQTVAQCLAMTLREAFSRGACIYLSTALVPGRFLPSLHVLTIHYPYS